MVTIDYVCHSCILVTTSDTTILFDPWFHGPCYNGQWFVFPKPVGVEKILNAEHIVLTHGHEDHMHRPSLEKLNKAATVWFPYQWREGIEGYMKHIGFAKVKEAVTLRTYQLRAGYQTLFSRLLVGKYRGHRIRREGDREHQRRIEQ